MYSTTILKEWYLDTPIYNSQAMKL